MLSDTGSFRVRGFGLAARLSIKVKGADHKNGTVCFTLGGASPLCRRRRSFLVMSNVDPGAPALRKRRSRTSRRMVPRK